MPRTKDWIGLDLVNELTRWLGRAITQVEWVELFLSWHLYDEIKISCGSIRGWFLASLVTMHI